MRPTETQQQDGRFKPHRIKSGIKINDLTQQLKVRICQIELKTRQNRTTLKSLAAYKKTKQNLKYEGKD